jgi:clan AA aspartic protease (TIGR02281 family)
MLVSHYSKDINDDNEIMSMSEIDKLILTDNKSFYDFPEDYFLDFEYEKPIFSENFDTLIMYRNFDEYIIRSSIEVGIGDDIYSKWGHRYLSNGEKISDDKWGYYINGDLFYLRAYRGVMRGFYNLIGPNFKVIDDKIRLPLIKLDNLFYLNITIGNNKYQFLLDTGASDMLINSEIEEHLLTTGILRKSDYSESIRYTFADGSQKVFKTANLYTVKIEDSNFSNIKVAIGDSNSALLLGMSFLNKFDWKINGDVLELIEK